MVFVWKFLKFSFNKDSKFQASLDRTPINMLIEGTKTILIYVPVICMACISYHNVKGVTSHINRPPNHVLLHAKRWDKTQTDKIRTQLKSESLYLRYLWYLRYNDLLFAKTNSLYLKHGTCLRYKLFVFSWNAPIFIHL